ncbi:DUF308 domain-containing protein [Candidatus Saccharibacteria bacterium]|nr:DUF308 domain-containing protein [Candidatus Saccharibacteria bacterium]
MAKVEIIKHSAEKISGNLKQSAWMAVIESLATIVIGILLVVWPDVVIKVIAYVVGIFFIVKGAYQIINYFVVKGQTDFFNNGLLFGVISVLVGITALVIGEEIANIFRIIIGIWMIYESLVRINTAIKLHAANIQAWKYILILALIMLVLGMFVTFYSGAIITLIGWMMVLVGIVGIIGDVMFIQYVDTLITKITGSTK